MHMIEYLALQLQHGMCMMLLHSMLSVVLWEESMGDQRSPGIIPLAVKDAFSIIQETPSREFLLRVSYLEIYNEVVNDLLNPAGQNLRIREDSQGTFVEGIKDEVVLSPAHALSLIAAGEEHRHVGSTNFNLLSSRSHTIFTLTIESSPYGENCEGEAVTLSQLNLIDLAGSESSKAETTGVRRKEGSYINKSLLTLGTVISKLTDGRSAHVPYRDSKLTRLLQSSLSGQGRVSIIDEKSLIKKYQTEIRCLKEELEKLRRGIVTVPQAKDTGGDDILLLKQKLEDGQVRLQSRLEQEEEAKAALMGRIQRLTKLILVSTKASPSSRIPHRPGPRRRHSFGEEELAYLPHRRRDLILDDENDLNDSLDGSAENTDDTLKEEKRPKKNGLLKWLKLRKRDSGTGTFASSSDKSSGMKSTSIPSTPQAESINIHMEARHQHSLLIETAPSDVHLSDARENEDVLPDDDFLGQESPLTSMKTMDQIDLLREQQKILSGEVALHTSALKRLSEEAAQNPRKEHPQAEMSKLNEEIRRKNEQIASLGKQIGDCIVSTHDKKDFFQESQSVSELMERLNEKSFELEVKAADNRIIQEQLNQKITECKEYQETITTLRQQLSDTLEPKNCSPLSSHSQRFLETKGLQVELHTGKKNAVLKDGNGTLLLQAQANEIEELKRRITLLTESKEELELRNNKLAEESSYAKGLASAAAVELKALSEEVAKLMKHNEKLAGELEVQKNSPTQRRNTISNRNGRRDSHVKRHEQSLLASDMKREMALSREKELSYEAALAEKDQREADLHRKVEESKQREAYLENELANMWVLVAKLKKSQGVEND
ncbi:kinesin KIN-7K, chloroplastic isoform X1 [Olea europaea subsp. europaea]|uniref:Kinesin-like protein n=1 Tax=Olea europaea subsp. europaea TaxID=158383 RepID=A0A8S0T2I8_OLEEU|nr:kinesin KIN-7K, chloroplastic isoform X1 [Olea europaea subsp. europaea]